MGIMVRPLVIRSSMATFAAATVQSFRKMNRSLFSTTFSVCIIRRQRLYQPPRSFPHGAFRFFDQFMEYVSEPRIEGLVDVVEIVVGEGGVGKLCARRRLKGGVEFDLVAGFNLVKAVHRDEVFRYIDTHTSLVILFGPRARFPVIGLISTRCCTQRRGVNQGRLACVLPSLRQNIARPR